MLKTHELYMLAESPNLRVSPAAQRQRALRYRTRTANNEKIALAANADRLSVDHVAILGET